MDVTIGTQVDALFTTTNPVSGALQDAAILPTGVVYKDGAADALSVTVVKKATGLYVASYTPTSVAGFQPGNDVSCMANATVGGVAGGAVIRQDRIKDVGGSTMAQKNARSLLTAAHVMQYTCPAGTTATVYANMANVETAAPAARTVNVRLVPNGDTPGDEHLIIPDEPLAAFGSLGDRVGPLGPFVLVAGDLVQAKADVTGDVDFRLEIFEMAVPV